MSTMTANVMRKPTSVGFTQALLLSVLLHVLLAVAWIVAVALEVFVLKAASLKEEAKPEPTAFVQMQPAMVQTLQEAEMVPAIEEPLPEPEPEQKSFQSTTNAPESAEAPESSRYFGARDTAAASEQAGDPASALEVPTQDGVEERFPGDLELANSDFADGEEEGSAGKPGEPNPLSQSAATTEAQEGSEAAVAQPEMVPEDPLPEVAELTEPEKSPEVIDLLSLENSLEVPILEVPEDEETEEVEESIPEPKPQEEREEQEEMEATLPGGGGERGTENGYDREARRTRAVGSIGRRGVNSLDVENTARGRYLAEVNKQIEKAWQRECILRRQHIMPGVLAVRFLINPDGKVGAFQFDSSSRIAGGAIQEGFTMIAVTKKAKLPTMPDEMKDELAGEPLEMSLTFHF